MLISSSHVLEARGHYQYTSFESLLQAWVTCGPWPLFGGLRVGSPPFCLVGALAEAECAFSIHLYFEQWRPHFWATFKTNELYVQVSIRPTAGFCVG
jgi:hypothetical protein